MKFAVALSLLITSGLTAPAEVNESSKTSSKAEEGPMPVAVFFVVPEKAALFREVDALTGLSQESALPLSVGEDRSIGHYGYQDPYANTAAYKPQASSEPASGAVATFPSAVTETAIPLLLNCAPKVETGCLVESSPPAYRSAASDVAVIAEILSPFSPAVDFNLSDILNMKSVTSLISPEGKERKKRSIWTETGATHYKVSEDYPELHQGNHHLVSKDYPYPNMMRATGYGY